MENDKWKMEAADPTPHLERFDTYEQACQQFRWIIPKRFNFATEICRRHPDAVTRIALSDVKQGAINTYTFGGLDFLSDKFATALSNSGIKQGDSVAVALPSSAALIIAHLAALKAGAVVVPVSLIYDAPLLELALRDSNARAVVVHETDWYKVEGLAQRLPSLHSRFVVSDLRPAVREVKEFWAEIDSASSQFEAVETDAGAPAFILYLDLESQITGVVHSHSSAIAQLAAFELLVESDSERSSACDWSRPSALLELLYPELWYGYAVVADASHADPLPHRKRLHEVVFGKPETGRIIAKCERWFTSTPGSLGRPVPGRSIEIIDKDGNVLPPEQVGHIAVHKSDPALFIGYHRAVDQTGGSFIGDWFLTGDMGYRSGDGDFFSSVK